MKSPLEDNLKKDFLSKWAYHIKRLEKQFIGLNFLKKQEYITNIEFESIHNEAEEICKILAKIIITLKGKI